MSVPSEVIVSYIKKAYSIPHATTKLFAGILISDSGVEGVKANYDESLKLPRNSRKRLLTWISRYRLPEYHFVSID